MFKWINCGKQKILTLKFAWRQKLKYFNFSSTAADSKFLKTLLSFAVGGLLGDVFLHLLPEAWESDMKERSKTGKFHLSYH